MRKEFESLISKYGGNSQFEKNATQEEKEKYFLLKRAIEIEYNDYKFNHRNMVDSFFNRFIIEKETFNEMIIKDENEDFSIFTKKKFWGKSNIINPEIFRNNEFENQIEFNSLFQFLVFHKSNLFLDKDSAKKAIETEKRNLLLIINEGIKNYNEIVWTEFKTKILEQGIQSVFNSDSMIYNKFLNLENDIFIFESNYENWGVLNPKEFIEKEIMKQYNYKNYYGKILTRFKEKKINTNAQKSI